MEVSDHERIILTYILDNVAILSIGFTNGMKRGKALSLEVKIIKLTDLS